MARSQTMSSKLLLLALMCVLLVSTSCHKVLILPGISIGSHFLYLAKIGDHLKNQGHHVTLLLGKNHNSLSKINHIADSFHFENYTSAVDKDAIGKLDKMYTNFLKGEFDPMDHMIMVNILVEDCMLLLENKELFERLQKKGFDVILTNNGSPCTILMSQKLDLPFVIEWTEFMESSRHGVVILSFGSMTNLATNPEKMEVICAGLARLPQNVIMKYNGPPPTTLGNNTKLTKWMPQNDLLGHPNTKAFVTHGGMNGVYEAIYHAVPMVGFTFVR
ncbi:UDP-glucuronosyltransferase 2B30-like [Saccoglossus kowalevskii]|uniref:UDP-glucuronosyltransferase 2B19-like n=1 Tax=Saccoglossus kowalevskii TaxID=10224 RepID=A0ABM0MLJ0_SACKO|nr:PREDICTED: UDP-glucuronosyltransferase 2B19-like [Saccoglossus kowalevskii]